MDKIKQFVNEHPQWTSWIVLAIGMVAILVWSARDVGLLPGQWAALIIATILVAGLAVWIIGWEDDDDDDEVLEEVEREGATPGGGLFRRRAPKQAEVEDGPEPSPTEEA